MKETVLIVEDERKLSRYIELELTHEGYEVEKAFDGREALEMLQKKEYDFMLLDIMLPKINGIEVCRQTREFSNIPIIMLTAKNDPTDKIIGLDLGADDYMTKPFVIEELLARIRAVKRRSGDMDEKKEKIIQIDDLTINISRHEVRRGGIKIELSKKVFEVLLYLAQNKGIVLSREKILMKVWGYDYLGNDNILDVYIKQIRDKVDKGYEKKLISTVRGIGFKID